MFDRRIEVTVGETVERDGFAFTDLIPAAPLSSRARPKAETQNPSFREHRTR
jgi:hypothetical protein